MIIQLPLVIANKVLYERISEGDEEHSAEWLKAAIAEISIYTYVAFSILSLNILIVGRIKRVEV